MLASDTCAAITVAGSGSFNKRERARSGPSQERWRPAGYGDHDLQLRASPKLQREVGRFEATAPALGSGRHPPAYVGPWSYPS